MDHYTVQIALEGKRTREGGISNDVACRARSFNGAGHPGIEVAVGIPVDQTLELGFVCLVMEGEGRGNDPVDARGWGAIGVDAGKAEFVQHVHAIAKAGRAGHLAEVFIEHIQLALHNGRGHDFLGAGLDHMHHTRDGAYTTCGTLIAQDCIFIQSLTVLVFGTCTGIVLEGLLERLVKATYLSL